MRERWRPALTVGVSVALLAACSEVAGPEGWRQPGVLLVSGWPGNVPLSAGTGAGVTWSVAPGETDIAPPQVLVAPDSVGAGQPFEVVTYTVGPSGCWRGDGQSLALDGRTVLLRPYDEHSGAEVCTMALHFMAHRSTMALSETGVWTLKVEGRRLRMGDDVWEEPIWAERTLVVR
ncbi:MAG TPA: hypothetical protein VFZ69_07730 [Longimicrobiales bacterium]